MVSSILFAALALQKQPPLPAPSGPRLRAAVSGFDISVREAQILVRLPSGVPQ